MPTPIGLDFQSNWDRLVKIVYGKGVPYIDAEDLVSATLQVALENYDDERGEFFPFCHEILRNKIKNFWRDRRIHDPIDEVDIPDTFYAAAFEEVQERERMKEMIERIQNVLTEEEKEFLNALGRVYEEFEDAAVSQAAVAVGLEPLKGWNIFRRIQRKAKHLFPVREIEEPIQARFSLLQGTGGPTFRAATVSDRSMAYRHPSPPTIVYLARFAAREQGYKKAMASLSPAQESRLRTIMTQGPRTNLS